MAEAAVESPVPEMRRAGIDVRPIPRVDDASPEDLRRAVRRRSGPMLFGGLCGSWPAMTGWTPANLRRAYGEKKVTALVDLPGDGVLYPKDQKEYERTLTFGEFIDIMVTTPPSSPCYLAYQKADQIFNRADYDFGALLQDGDGETRVWIGSGGTRSMLHSDLRDNLFCQISGRKSVTLLPWRDTRAAYPFTGNIVNSQVDLADPDVGRFPRLRKVTFYSSVVGPGDVVLIPRGCWHDIRAATPSVSINHWFGTPQTFREYMRVLLVLGPRYWGRTARDLFLHGVLERQESVRFFFSPPSTGRRLYQVLRRKGFSHENDPVEEARDD